jgi:glycosyltransferase involved in cell wall biosynthesis
MLSPSLPTLVPLSVLIVTYNEAHNIEACLRSVSFAKEIIVIDSGSTDQTVSIAKQYTPHVTVTNWPGDGPQKQRAFEQASQDWILILDADEQVSPELAIELSALCATDSNTHKIIGGYDIPYQSYYFGHAIKFGDWRGEKHLRLFNRHYGHITPDIVHCQVKLTTPKKKTRGKIIHHPFRSLDVLLHKMNVYSSESAKYKFSHHKRANLFTAIGHGLWCFIRGYILKLGCLDGQAGFMLALSNAHGAYYRYLKLMMLNHAKS